MTSTVLDVSNLRTTFHTDDGIVTAVDDISFRIELGQTLGIVGESGSGKSVTSLTIMRLLAETAEIESGRISFLGKDLIGLPEPAMRDLRGRDVSMIFQEPMTSLNPVYTVGDQVAEAIVLHQKVNRTEAKKRTVQLLDEVGIANPADRYRSYPHQMSGGQKQRVMIAMALSCNPQLLIADEPTTALDVTIQAQILDILRRLRDSRGMSIIFITHDLGVIAEIADDVLVMFRGRTVEYDSVVNIFERPQHPYTKGLLACRPQLESTYRRLPTVADFMETEEAGGTTRVTEKQLTAERLRELTSHGRGRLLHPKSELAEMDHPWEEGSIADAQAVEELTEPLVQIKNLKVHFPVRRGLLGQVADYVRAVDGVSVDVYRGQTLGLVGESGCGKTTLGRAVLRLIEPTAGTVVFNGVDLRGLDHREMRALRRKMQIVFQDPYGSLNPRMTIEQTLIEPMYIHRLGENRSDRRDRAAAILEEVGMEAAHLRRYPHEFSGGQRQRICIARAIAVEPEFIICDESVSALDVSVQAQVLNLLKELQDRRGLTYIFISHDLSVVKFMADMMAVMNNGRFVEFGPSDNIYAYPREEYTRQLIEATPNDDIRLIRQRVRERAELRAKREEQKL